MPRHNVNGIQLNVERFGEGPPLVMLHGFTGSVGAWQWMPEQLGERFTVYAVDLIGHGESSAPTDPARYCIENAVDDLATLMDLIGIDSAIVLGYSMGGRVALHFALADPERVETLILESAAPGISNPNERAARIASDERLARMIETEGLERFVDQWESIPLFASQRTLPTQLRRKQRDLRLAQSPIGLANSLRGMGAGAMEPVADRIGEIRMPVLYLAGELDQKYCQIGQTMVCQIPNAEYVEISGAGHTIHLERPEEYARCLCNAMIISS
jgi:2-succinyl-6-hydroxy-2,4-cyclohexadiene-1-carboxylate synthase